MKKEFKLLTSVLLTLFTGAFVFVYFLKTWFDQDLQVRLDRLRQVYETDLVNELRGRVEMAYSFAKYFSKTASSTEEAQRTTFGAISEIRFDDGNYIWVEKVGSVFPNELRLLVHPASTTLISSELERTDLAIIDSIYHEGRMLPKTHPLVRNIQGKNLWQTTQNICLEKGEGSFSYHWPKTFSGKQAREAYRKVSYIKYFPEWQCAFGVGAYADKIDMILGSHSRSIQADYRQMLHRGFFIFLVIALGTILFIGFRIHSAQKEDIRELEREIDVRTKAESESQANEYRYRTLYEGVPIGIYKTSPAGDSMDANPAFLKLIHAESLESLSKHKSVDIYSDPSDSARLVSFLEKKDVVHDFVFSGKCLDGLGIWLRTTIRAVRDASGKVVYYEGCYADFTAQKQAEDDRARLEEQLRHSQKIESVGRLAGGVAHDFNNHLTAIMGNISLALLETGTSPKMTTFLKDALSAAESAARTTRQLLAFSRKQVIAPRTMELNHAVSEIQKILVRLIGEDVILEIKPAEKKIFIKGDPLQLEQVLINLAVNARDAMPSGGRLTISMGIVEISREEAESLEGIKAGSFARLEVTDTGKGMTAEVLEHVFEPFFTTKPHGRGTGFGLSLVYGAVRQNNGFIKVHSVVDHGTTFRIMIPLVSMEEADESLLDESETHLKHGNEYILLVEDEEIVRNFSRQALEQLGYNVIECDSGKSALEAFKKQRDKIKLLFSDVILPDIDGPALFMKLREIKLGLKVLFTSGYTYDKLAERGMKATDFPILEKPYSLAVLAKKIREALKMKRPDRAFGSPGVDDDSSGQG